MPRQDANPEIKCFSTNGSLIPLTVWTNKPPTPDEPNQALIAEKLGEWVACPTVWRSEHAWWAVEGEVNATSGMKPMELAATH
jgi:hypothetical protein